ncbi:hypothetical protein BU17DRAFT_72678, partial [Hysterangium stoloniferum]
NPQRQPYPGLGWSDSENEGVPPELTDCLDIDVDVKEIVINTISRKGCLGTGTGMRIPCYGLKMRMQTKANLNVDVAQSPTVPEYPYMFPRVPPSPSCPASNPPAAWAGGAMSIVQTINANGHLQAHIHDNDTGKDPTIAQNDDNTHGDGGGGGMNMNESMESAQKPPRSPLFDARDPFRREGRGQQTQTQIRAPMSAPASITTTPSRGLGVSRVWVCWGGC